jgi:lipoprotein-anchoring transpeptidase ErfK/SrfK
MLSRRQVITGAAGLAAGSALAGCTNAAGAAGTKWGEPGSSIGPMPSAPPVEVTFAPVADSKDVAPGEPIVVTAAGGTLQAVTVTAGNASVAGAVDTDQHTWRSTGDLAYGQTYTITVSVTNAAGASVQKTSTFSTLKPAQTTSVTFQANALTALKSGGTYGVGQIPIVRFSRVVADRAAAEKAVNIQTSPPVEGKFYWLDKQTLHWRPEKYFAAGSKITIGVKIFGVNLGNNVYGAANASTSYNIGVARIAIVDSVAHQVTVFQDGQQIRAFPCSTGKNAQVKAADGHTINYNTNSGPHVVLEKVQTVRMTSASYGLTDKKDPNFYDENVELCTRISYSGEYCHAAPWNGNIGRANTSHGCVNLRDADAKWVFDTFTVGDIVDVRGTPVTLSIGNGLGDWAVPWAQYGH